MKLQPISAMGIRAYCSHIIIDPYDFETVYFMSICGYQNTVKGILANILENYGVSMTIEDHEYNLKRSEVSYKTQLKKLPSGLVHAMLFPKTALPRNDDKKHNSFHIFTEKDTNVLNLFFRHIDMRTEIPLHPSWSEWLWKAFSEQERWFLELKTLTGAYCGYSFSFDQKLLHDVISEAIRAKVPEIIQCMRWRGGDGNG